MSNRDVAAQYGVPKGTLSTWIKSKEKHLDSLEKGRNIKWQNLRTCNFEIKVKAVFNWFLSMPSQNVTLSADMDQEKVPTKELNVGEGTFGVSTFNIQLCWKLPSIRWLLRLLQGNRKLLHHKWLMGGAKRLFRLFYQTASLNLQHWRIWIIWNLIKSLKSTLAES